MTPAPETKIEKDNKTEKDKLEKEKQEKKKTNLGSLEEDDEFEEFRTQGKLFYFKIIIRFFKLKKKVLV